MTDHKRKLGLAMVTALVLGNMVGSGIFLLPASLAPFGAWSLGGWLVSSAGALLLAWTFSRLARRRPSAGGPYAYTRAGFGDCMGFLIAWGYWIGIVAANAAIAVALVGYLGEFIPALATRPLPGALATLAVVWILIGVNIAGIRSAGSVQLVTTVLKVLPLLAVAVFGLAYFNPDFLLVTEPVESPVHAINATVALTLWAFLGLESATIPADHVRDAPRTIPRATLIGTLIAALLYIACTTAVMGIIPASELATSTAPFADAARLLWGDWAGWLIAAAAVISCFGALNGWVLLSGQIPRAVARDRLFPSFFAPDNPRGTPARGLLVAGVLTSILVMMNYQRGLVAMFTFIILLSTLSTLIPYIFCAMTEFIQTRAEGGGARRTGNLIAASGAFAYALWATAGTGKDAVYWGFLLILVGVPIYAWQVRDGAPSEPSERPDRHRD